MRHARTALAVIYTSLLLAFSSTALAQPFQGTPWAIPGQVEIENYDLGGQLVGYRDTTIGNKGGVYRSDDVDIWNDGSQEGFYVGAMATTELLEYTVNVAAAGDYQLQLRLSTPKDGRIVHVEFGGADLTGPISAIESFFMST